MSRARVLADYVAGGTTAAEFDVLDGLTSTTAELNILDGVTSTTTELNYVDGVTSNVQTQMDAKAPLASPVLVTPNLGTPSAVTLTNATFPAGHIIKITRHTSTQNISANNTLAVEGDSYDCHVSCTIGNKLHIFIIGGMGYASDSGGYFSWGVRIEESGQGDVDFLGSILYSRTYGSVDDRYHNDTVPSVMYTHTAVTSACVIKRFTKAHANFTSYWKSETAGGGQGISYCVMEEQV